VDNLITAFIECFTDVDSLKNALRLRKKYSKKLPLDYSFYLKEIRFSEILSLTKNTIFDSDDLRIKITRLAIKYCPNLKTLSLKRFNTYQGQLLVSIKNLPHLQTLELHSRLNNSTFNTLSRVVKNLKSISLDFKEYNFEQVLHPSLQKLVQSQRQLKTITIKNVTAKMRSVLKLLESQSNFLESIVLEKVNFDSDDLKGEPVKFHQLKSIHIKNCQILTKRGLRSIFKADLPNLEKLKFENTDWRYKSDWTPLRSKYGNQIVYSGTNKFVTSHN